MHFLAISYMRDRSASAILSLILREMHSGAQRTHCQLPKKLTYLSYANINTVETLMVYLVKSGICFSGEILIIKSSPLWDSLSITPEAQVTR